MSAPGGRSADRRGGPNPPRPDTSRLDAFRRQVLVHWNDCDPARIVFHANFVRWMDEGFTEMTRARGVDFAALLRADTAFRGCPLVDVRCTFRSPARYADLLTHEIAPPEFTGRSFRLAHRFSLPDGTLAAEGEQVRIWGREADGRLRAVEVPADVVTLLGG